eukprot:3497666-Rhodomonas_salina.1
MELGQSRERSGSMELGQSRESGVACSGEAVEILPLALAEDLWQFRVHVCVELLLRAEVFKALISRSTVTRSAGTKHLAFLHRKCFSSASSLSVRPTEAFRLMEPGQSRERSSSFC